VQSRVPRLGALPSLEGSYGAITCPTGPSELWTTGIKKCLAALVTQLGSRISKVCSYVTEAPADVQVAIVRLCSAASTQLTTPEHSCSCDMTRQDSTTALTMFSTAVWQTTRPDVPTSLETSFTTLRHYDHRCCIRFQSPRGHLSGPGSPCNCSTLSYKRLGQTPLHRDE
jgi:hypothetical protein